MWGACPIGHFSKFGWGRVLYFRPILVLEWCFGLRHEQDVPHLLFSRFDLDWFGHSHKQTLSLRLILVLCNAIFGPKLVNFLVVSISSVFYTNYTPWFKITYNTYKCHIWECFVFHLQKWRFVQLWGWHRLIKVMVSNIRWVLNLMYFIVKERDLSPPKLSCRVEDHVKI